MCRQLPRGNNSSIWNFPSGIFTFCATSVAQNMEISLGKFLAEQLSRTLTVQCLEFSVLFSHFAPLTCRKCEYNTENSKLLQLYYASSLFSYSYWDIALYSPNPTANHTSVPDGQNNQFFYMLCNHPENPIGDSTTLS